MKKILLFAIVLAGLTSCYDDFVKDYDYNAIYLTYQYDMRTMIIGESASFDITACLGGVISNKQDRDVKMVIDNSLVTADLSQFAPDDLETPVSPFTAYDIFNGGTPGVGTLYHTEVQTKFATFGIKSISPLPENYYTVSGLDGLKIKSGNHTGAFTISATDAMKDDDLTVNPIYAIGVRIESADADKVPIDRSFTVIAVRCENQFYGNWYHGGASVTKDANGNVINEEKYEFAIPQEDDRIYTLSTVGTHSVVTDKYGSNHKGALKLSFDKDNNITITSDAVNLVNDGRKSYANNAKLLQDRVLYLNYSYKDASDNTVEVSDSLVFRNRMRDGANEWQDEVTEHYN